MAKTTELSQATWTGDRLLPSLPLPPPLSPHLRSLRSNIVSDNCMVHSHEACLLDQLCTWDSSRLLCADYHPSLPDDGRAMAGTCTRPRTMQAGSGTVVAVKPQDCKRWVDQPAALLVFDSEAQSMFYHW
jgi:hypothetical protein